MSGVEHDAEPDQRRPAYQDADRTAHATAASRPDRCAAPRRRAGEPLPSAPESLARPARRGDRRPGPRPRRRYRRRDHRASTGCADCWASVSLKAQESRLRGSPQSALRRGRCATPAVAQRGGRDRGHCHGGHRRHAVDLQIWLRVPRVCQRWHRRALRGHPTLYRFGELVAPLAFITVAYLSMTFLCWHFGTGTGVQFYFLIAAAAAVMVVGIERIGLAIAAAAIGVSLVIALQFTVPRDTGAKPAWFITVGFIVNTIAAGVLAVAIVWYGLRQIASAEAAMEQEYAALRSIAGQHPAGQHRQTAQGPLEFGHRRQIRRRLNPFRRYRRQHRPGQRHLAGGVGRLPRRPLHQPGCAGDPARFGEGEDQRRRVHGGQRRPTTTSRPP